MEGAPDCSTLQEPKTPVMGGQMETNINLLSLTPVMSFLTNHKHHPEANLETEL